MRRRAGPQWLRVSVVLLLATFAVVPSMARAGQGAAQGSRVVDRIRVAAERLLSEGDALAAEYRESSTRAAIRKYESSIKNWVAISDVAEEVKTLNSVSRLYRELGETD